MFLSRASNLQSQATNLSAGALSRHGAHPLGSAAFRVPKRVLNAPHLLVTFFVKSFF
jgi:hypothetical protein